MGEFLFNLLLLVFFIAMTAYGFTIKIWGEYWGARWYPMILLIFAVIIFAVKVVRIWKKLPKEQRKFDLSVFGFKDKGVQKLLISFAMLLFYAFIIQYIGYILATIALITGMAMLLGAGKITKVLLAAVVITLLLYGVFTWGLDVRPPRGVGFIYDINLWLESLI